MLISLDSMHVVALKNLVNQPPVLMQTWIRLFNTQLLCPPPFSQAVFAIAAILVSYYVPGPPPRTSQTSFHLKLPAVSKIDTMCSDYLEQINGITEAHMLNNLSRIMLLTCKGGQPRIHTQICLLQIPQWLINS